VLKDDAQLLSSPPRINLDAYGQQIKYFQIQ
jgi:hypothetical protein